MSQNTEERLKQLEGHIRDVEKRLKEVEEQQTEPIKLTIERPYPDVDLQWIKNELQSLANEHGKGLLMHSRHISTLHDDVKDIKARISLIKESLADLRDRVLVMPTQDDLGRLEERLNMIVTKEDGERIQADTWKIRESLADLRDSVVTKNDLKAVPTKEDLSLLEGRMATKEDLSLLEGRMATKEDVTAIKSDVGRLEAIMLQVLNKLPEQHEE
jgi:hypothetical protein